MVVIGGNIIGFLYCQAKKDNSYIDVFWGLTFITPIAALLIAYAVIGQEIYARVILNAVLVSIWGFRLAYHIGIRHTKEDFRYVDMRTRWMQGGEAAYYLQAFVYIFMLQGLFSLIVNSASLFTTIYTSDNTLIWSDYVGAAVWIFGFAFECLGDHQLKVHLADRTEGKKKFIMWGLWRYTRHPNYFGEAMLWWGIWIIAAGIQWGWVVIYAPLFIGVLIRWVSGVPLLEAKYSERQDWKEYCHETNCFFPWFVNTDPLPMIVRDSEKQNLLEAEQPK